MVIRYSLVPLGDRRHSAVILLRTERNSECSNEIGHLHHVLAPLRQVDNVCSSLPQLEQHDLHNM